MRKITVTAATAEVYKVQITFSPEEEARQYALEAKESADEAADSATQAGNSATQAGQSAASALASEQNAAQSESNAATSAGEAAASAGEAATSAGEAAQSASNALTSEQNASASEQAAAQSEANALSSEQSASQDAQTATTQAGIATTKAGEAATSASNALTSEQNAAQSEIDAETAASQAIAAKDEIVDKIDFTGLVEGDILRHNGTELVKISEFDFWKRSPSATMNNSKFVYAWDNFDRPNQSGLGSLISGQSWTIENGSNAQILNQYAKVTDLTRAMIPRQGLQSFGQRIDMHCNTGPGDNQSIFAIFKQDDQNFIEIGFNPINIIMYKTVGGVRTLLSLKAISPNTNFSSARSFQVHSFSAFIFLQLGKYVLKGIANDFPDSDSNFDASNDSQIANIISNITQVGFSGEAVGPGISSFAASTLLRL